MNKKIFMIIAIVLIATLVLAACERPATRAPMATATTEGEIPFPVPTNDILKQALAGTQTAQALTPKATSSGPTKTPGAVDKTPEATSQAEPTKTMVAFATPTPGRPETYKIQDGEFLYCIARRFNVSVADLFSLNGMNNNSQPSVGTKIKIPQSGSFGSGRALHKHPASYTVVAGDTIGEIACYYGDVDPYSIYGANGLEQGSALKVGQLLQIP